MNIKSGLTAGMSYEQCTELREWWKDMARNGPCVANPNPPTPGTPPPTSAQPPTSTASIQPACYGGYVNGVYYPDLSGTCGV
jgi:hypothetical protein